MKYIKSTEPKTNELYHYRTKGSKNGVRRYQNPDGTLTAEGYAHYGYDGPRQPASASNSIKPSNYVKPNNSMNNYSNITKPIQNQNNQGLTQQQKIAIGVGLGLAATAAIGVAVVKKKMKMNNAMFSQQISDLNKNVGDLNKNKEITNNAINFLGGKMAKMGNKLDKLPTNALGKEAAKNLIRSELARGTHVGNINVSATANAGVGIVKKLIGG